jgi:4-amino-4-deoxy-L-arabinose transferase-like glycosyltransferase
MWNADTRIFLAASIVDQGQLSIDPYEQFTGDKAAYNGHYYSDKAPGSSLLAVPVYLFVKLTLYQGKTSYLHLLDVSDAKRTDFLARYLMTLLLVGLPSAFLGALLFCFLASLGLGLRGRMLLIAGYGLGTMSFAFSTVFFGHQIAALLLFAAFYLLFSLRQGRISRWHYLTAGLLASYAIITEYPTALIVGCLTLYVLYHARSWYSLLLFIGGMLPSLGIAAVYNTLCFGGPFNQGYANLAGPEAFRVGQAQGLFGVTAPHLDALWQTTFGPYRGLFLLSPFLLLAFPGFWLLFRQRIWRSETVLWLSIVAVYFLFAISYYAWDGGYSLGPRHFIPALPFLVLPIASVLKRRGWVRNLSVTLIGLSIVIVTLATAVYPLNDPRFDAPLTERVLPLIVGIQPDAAHPALPFPTIWSGFLEAPLLTHAQLDNNWGELFGLPGIWQLLPFCIGITIVLARFWWFTRPKSVTIPQMAPNGSVLLVSTQIPVQAEGAHLTPDAERRLSLVSPAERQAGEQPALLETLDERADPSSSPGSAHPGLPIETIFPSPPG